VTHPDETRPPTGRLANWAGNIAFAPARFEHPETLDAARETVARAERLRVLGSGHSFNRIAASDEVMLSLIGITPEIDVDAAARTVRASGWVTYAALCRAVHAAGFALPNMASLPHISVAGSIATGTHGSGDRNGGLGTAVSALEFIGPDGETSVIDRSDPDFAGAVVHLGALGVVTHVTLDVEPDFAVRQYVYDGLALDAAIGDFDAITASAYSVSLFTRWGTEPEFLLWRKQRVDARSEPFPKPKLFGAALADGPRHPIPGADTAACTDQMGRTGPWHERLPHFRAEFTPSAGEELQSEYLVARGDATAALAALREVGASIEPAVQICEVRTIAEDDLWLSPAYGRDTVGLHFTWVRDEAVAVPAMSLVESALRPFNPRPHWGKLFAIEANEIRSRYPRIGDFAKLARQRDPSGKFTNAFVEAITADTA
jgi:xylitol oxidase